ncbi:hypothetical protein FRC08_007690 [Ceratobasidium sp. 394]|nr:hypothetical protein FRC08_007690 [Ceratobasidium sp. 394]
MSLPLVVLAGLNFLCSVAGLPSGGSGGTRGGSGGSKGGSGGGSSGGSGGGSSGGSKSSSGSGWTSSRNNGQRSNSGPLSKGAKIAFAVIGGIIVAIIVFIVIHRFLERFRERRKQHSTTPEKTMPSGSSRSSINPPANMSHNPGHTQAAVHHVSHPTNASELTSAVMTGEGSRAGHGQEGAGDGSRGGVGAVVWEARALAAVSKGMSCDDRSHAPNSEAAVHPPMTVSMPIPHPN